MGDSCKIKLRPRGKEIISDRWLPTGFFFHHSIIPSGHPLASGRDIRFSYFPSHRCRCCHPTPCAEKFMALYFLCLVWVVSFYCVFIDEWVSSYATFYRRTQSSISVKRSDVMQFAGMAGNCPYYLISLCWKKKKNKTNPPKKYFFKYKKVWTLHSYMRVIITREISPFNGNPRSSFPTLFLAQFSCVKVEEGIRSIPRNKESKEKRKKKNRKKSWAKRGRRG